MYIDFKIGDSKLEQFSFMEMTDIEYSIFKELFFQNINFLVNKFPQYSKPAIEITKELKIAENEKNYYENLIASKEL
jgi:hypothetical protein